MSRRFAAILLGLALAATAVPAIAHSVNYTTRETGTVECDFNDDVRTDIVAVGHQRHTRVGYEHVFIHTPTDRWSGRAVFWDTFAMNWATANQTGYSYDFLGSGGGCAG